MDATKLSISQYHGQQELSYCSFPLTPEGLAEAREYLAVELVNHHRRGLSPWQFESPYGGDLDAAYKALQAGDCAVLEALLSAAAEA